MWSSTYDHESCHMTKKTVTRYVPRVRDTGPKPKHDGKAFRVRTKTNPAGQFGTRKWAEEVLARALRNDRSLVRVGVGTEKVAIDDQADPNVWLTGDLVAINKVPTRHRDDYRDSVHALANAAREYGEVLHLNESYRTYEQQVRFWELYQAGGNLAAKPGTSPHEFGVAFDIPNAWTNKRLAGILKKHGFKQTVPGERWHVERVK